MPVYGVKCPKCEYCEEIVVSIKSETGKARSGQKTGEKCPKCGKPLVKLPSEIVFIL